MTTLEYQISVTYVYLFWMISSPVTPLFDTVTIINFAGVFTDLKIDLESWVLKIQIFPKGLRML